MKNRILFSLIALLATAAQTTIVLVAMYGTTASDRPLHAVVEMNQADARA